MRTWDVGRTKFSFSLLNKIHQKIIDPWKILNANFGHEDKFLKQGSKASNTKWDSLPPRVFKIQWFTQLCKTSQNKFTHFNIVKRQIKFKGIYAMSEFAHYQENYINELKLLCRFIYLFERWNNQTTWC